jgi:hypothetical protein
MRVSGLTPSSPVGSHAADGEALPVIALLHAGVQVAVLVEGDKELGEELLSGHHVEPALAEVGLQVGPHVLVEPTQPHVVMATQPHHGVQKPQRLEGFVEGARGMGGHLRQGGGHDFATGGARRLCIARREGEDGVDGLDGGVEERDGGGVIGEPRAGCEGHLLAPEEPLRQHHAPVGADVADGA